MGNRNEWPLSGRLTLPRNGGDGREAAVRSPLVGSIRDYQKFGTSL
jgi:hypothetical protein